MLTVAVTVLVGGSTNAPVDPSDQETGVSLTGPAAAPVPARYASSRAARETVLTATHRHSTPGMAMSGDDMADMGTSPTTTSPVLAPSTYGEWTEIDHTNTVRAIHVTALLNGKVLLMAGSGNDANELAARTFTAEVWDPVNNTTKEVPPPWDMFCAGHLVDKDGNVLVMGGTSSYPATGGKWKGSSKVYRFNISTETWEQRSRMTHGRWYPTVVSGASGNNVYVYSGKNGAGDRETTPERYNIATDTWTKLPDVNLPLYPGLIWTTGNRLFFTGAATGMTKAQTGLLSPNSGRWTPVYGGVDMTTRSAAASLLAGDASNQLAWLAGGGFPAVKSTVFTDLRSGSPTSVRGPDLPVAKAYVSTVNLPTLQVLETGGGTGRKTPVYEASILDPLLRTITPVAPPAIGRTYHSSAILLADGSVATFGGDPGDGRFEFRIEIYKPSYFFNGPRPTITSAPTEVSYGKAYPVRASATDSTLASAVLARPASTTHSTDSNQRIIRLTTANTATGLSVTLPAANSLAPPGWYMLFVNDSAGRPSTAKWVHLT